MQDIFAKFVQDDLLFSLEQAEQLWTDMVGTDEESQQFGITRAQWEGTVGTLYVATKPGIVTESPQITSTTLARIKPFDVVVRIGLPLTTSTGLQRFLCRLVCRSLSIEVAEGWITLSCPEESCLKAITGVSMSFSHIDGSGQDDETGREDCNTSENTRRTPEVARPAHKKRRTMKRAKRFAGSEQKHNCYLKRASDEIAYFQGPTSPKLLLPEKTFRHLVENVLASLGPATKFKFEAAAMKTLQYGTESYLCQLFRRSALTATHAKRTEVRPADFHFVQALCG